MKDIVIKISSHDEMVKVQEIVFSKGITWYGGSSDLKTQYNIKSLKIKNNNMVWCGGDCYGCSYEHECEHLTMSSISAKEFIKQHEEKEVVHPQKYITEQVAKQWRFKTEQEFLEEFGEGWRAVACVDFPKGMNYLLGQPVDWGKIERTGKLEYDNGSWYINEKMVTDKPLPDNSDVFYDPNYVSKEKFQVGDEVYIKGKIARIDNENEVKIIFLFGEHEGFNYFYKDQLHKSIPDNKEEMMKKLAEIDRRNKHADLQTIENVKNHLGEFETKELDSDFTAALNELSQKKHSSSVMLGSVDLSEEIKDEEILKNRERKE